MVIEGMCEPEGPGSGYILCEDAYATRFFVLDEAGRTVGNFETRDLAEEFVAAERRRSRFTWRPGDVEHH